MEYSSGHIYKIICSLDSNFVYIGSTFTTLRQRWGGHKDSYVKFLKKGSNNMSTHKYYKKYGIENFKIILIKSYNVCRNSQRDNAHLRAYEQLWINKTKRAVNLQNAFNPLAKLDKRIYNELNKEKLNEYHKEYRENNKEKMKEYNKEYSENNKEKINKREREKITCECGSIIIKKILSKHIKTKKHLKLMQNK
tara:strand:+ start:182 stop:763 length:582 start_codon:yes stop_codon:yes gene_type:complete